MSRRGVPAPLPGAGAPTRQPPAPTQPPARVLRPPRTLQGRLTLTALGAGSLAIVLLTVGFDLLLAHRLNATTDALLRTRAQAAVATIDVRPDGSLELADGAGETALDSDIWVYRGAEAVARPPGAQSLQRQADALAGMPQQIVRDDTSPPTEFLSLPVSLHGRQVGTVVAATSLDPYRRSARETVAGSAVLDAVLIGLVLLLVRSVVGRALQPVEEMTRQAGQWSVGDTSLRFGKGRRPTELDALAEGLDQLLDRLSAVLRREQQMSAEISHELRTPLAGIVAEAELFGARPRTTAQAEAAMAAVGSSARRLERILDTLLSAARAGSSGQVGRADALLVAQEAVATAPSRVPTTVSGEVNVWVGVDPEVLERVLAPLLENAQRFAATSIAVTAEVTGQHVRLRVVDDGPGIPAGQQEAVFEPGVRLSTSDGHHGAGLGLPLARRLATASGGRLDYEDGGFTVLLPRG